ncbi:hypothetical protein [Rickettsia honei]|uniref:hypothetical protein n=1 Tax=Rickettsia honei TaxID=37816 RepID=UPI00037360ED|nr:hypothetical protein [Rickettsia honei]
MNNNMFQALENNNDNAEDIKFLFDHTPSFANDAVNTTVICFRYAANLGLQPINRIIVYTGFTMVYSCRSSRRTK